MSVILAITLLFSQNFSVYAGNSVSIVSFDESVFLLDEKLLFAEFTELTDLDIYVEANKGVTFSDLENEGNLLIANMHNSAFPMGMAESEGEPPLGIPSFLWGCVFGVLGILIVYIVTENDKEEAKKAMWGCAVAGASYIVLAVVYFFVIMVAVTPLYYYD